MCLSSFVAVCLHELLDQDGNMPGNCSFNYLWLQDKELKEWIAPHPKLKTMAVCTACGSDFDIANNGISAVRSHAKGSKHKKNVKSQAEKSASSKIGDFFTSTSSHPVVDSPSTSGTAPPPSTATASKKNVSVSDFVSRDETLKAEILWALKTVSSHLSFKCANKTPWLFTSMFPDSKIAGKFSMSEKKCAS